MNEQRYSVAVIGGGAAGLCATIAYLKKNPGGKIVLLEKMDECGKKLLATGNGRCNISNTAVPEYEEIKDFFLEIGIPFRVDEEGRAYPRSNRALSVRDALVSACEKLGAVVETKSAVSSLTPNDDGFVLDCTLGEPKKIFVEKVLIATGGKAGPSYGSTGDGYYFSTKLGHEVKQPIPALVPLEYDCTTTDKLGKLKGVRAKTTAELFVGGESIASSSGEVQFNSDAISGIMIFDLSRKIPRPSEGQNHISLNNEVIIKVDLAPDMSEEELKSLLESEINIGLRGVLDERLAEYIEKEAKGDVDEMIRLVKGLEAKIFVSKGWKESQITGGGIALSEIDSNTGESLICKNLFFAGEILDEDFDCGGFNLSFAWTSGMRAGNNL